MVAGLPERTVSFGALRSSVPLRWESARITAFTLNSPKMPVMVARAFVPTPRLFVPGIEGALFRIGILSASAPGVVTEVVVFPLPSVVVV